MIANILDGANSTSIAINAFIPPFTHPTSVVFSQSPLPREDLEGKLGDNRVPGLITGLDFESMTPLDLAGTDWVNLREHSSDVVETSGSQVVGTWPNGQRVYAMRSTFTALVVDPADILAAIAKGVVATIPVWEVEYLNDSGRSPRPNEFLSSPPVRLGDVPNRLPRDHVFRLCYPGTTVCVDHTMTTTKRAASVTATYHPFLEL